MLSAVALRAQRDQIPFFVSTPPAAKDHVMYLQLLARPAVLATPAIPLQDSSVQNAIALAIESDSRYLEAAPHHEARRVTISERNASCWEFGRNL